MIKLDINKEDFKIYITLKEYNFKYNTNIQDIDIKKLDLNLKTIGNEGLENLAKIKFKELNKLYLGKNEISDINILEKVSFKKLEELDLKYNNISDISIFEKIKFKELKDLDLKGNNLNEKKNHSIINFLKSKIKKLYI